MTTFPLELEVQWTRHHAITQVDDYDPDSDNEDSIDAVSWAIGQSTDTIVIDSWKDIPHGYEPCDDEMYEEWAQAEDSED
jgi:hypothetical protein